VGKDGYEDAPAAALAAKLNALGERDVRLLDGGWRALSVRTDRPLELLPNFQKLVHVDWLRDLVAGRTVEAAPKGRWLLFHVNVAVWLSVRIGTKCTTTPMAVKAKRPAAISSL